ncbi:uncharacterized protein [Watersipora subatra]|uniref:uncharacterized protein n=1 Tax=Watersipora subatra TaxID=2589382 RepID=UPI00355C026C
MAMKWNLKNVTILTDSATVFGWVKSVLQDCKRPKVSGLSEMPVKGRLNLLNNLITTERWRPTVKKKDIEEVVKHFHVCKRIDPAPAHWKTGQVDVESDWYHLATDITHYQGIPYLTVIDCGPSRFAAWRKLRNETYSVVMEQLDHIFCQRGSPVKIFSDNGSCYRSFKPLLDKWVVNHIYSCAYRASGNGVIERNHRTIKRMLARSGGTLNDKLYWYNNSINADGVVPFRRLFYDNPQKQETTRISAKRDISLNLYKVGDQVYVKPGNAKCTSVWKTGKVTSLVSNTAVKVDDMNHYIGDIRFCWRVDKQSATLDCFGSRGFVPDSTRGLTAPSYSNRHYVADEMRCDSWSSTSTYLNFTVVIKKENVMEKCQRLRQCEFFQILSIFIAIFAAIASVCAQINNQSLEKKVEDLTI